MAVNFRRSAAVKGTRRGDSGKPERQLQAAMVEFYAVAVPPGCSLLFAVPNGELRDRVTGGMLVGLSAAKRELLPDDRALTPYGQGVVPGVPDLMLLTPGAHTTLVEVKAPKSIEVIDGRVRRRRGGVLRRFQRLFRAAAGRLGHDVRVIDNLEDWALLLREKGLTLRIDPNQLQMGRSCCRVTYWANPRRRISAVAPMNVSIVRNVISVPSISILPPL